MKTSYFLNLYPHVPIEFFVSDIPKYFIAPVCFQSFGQFLF